MKLSQFKSIVSNSEHLSFETEDGIKIPTHFHITEIGISSKHFIDCGGKERKESKVTFQLWSADDLDHRLAPTKLIEIISIGENKLHMEDLEIEIEYQSNTVGKYGLEHKDNTFVLTNTHTDCLAKENCGIPLPKKKLSLAELTQASNSCTPNGGCC